MVFSGTLSGGMLNRCRWFLQGGGCFALPTAIGHPHPHHDDDDDVWDDEWTIISITWWCTIYNHQGELRRPSKEVDLGRQMMMIGMMMMTTMMTMTMMMMMKIKMMIMTTMMTMIMMILFTRVTCKDSPEKLTFGRQSAKRQGFSLILLSDWLIVCKKKGWVSS